MVPVEAGRIPPSHVTPCHLCASTGVCAILTPSSLVGRAPPLLPQTPVVADGLGRSSCCSPFLPCFQSMQHISPTPCANPQRRDPCRLSLRPRKPFPQPQYLLYIFGVFLADQRPAEGTKALRYTIYSLYSQVGSDLPQLYNQLCVGQDVM